MPVEDPSSRRAQALSKSDCVHTVDRCLGISYLFAWRGGLLWRRAWVRRAAWRMCTVGRTRTRRSSSWVPVRQLPPRRTSPNRLPRRALHARTRTQRQTAHALRAAAVSRTDFSKAKCLLNADVAIILEHKRGQMQSKGIQPKRCLRSLHPLCARVKQCCTGAAP